MEPSSGIFQPFSRIQDRITTVNLFRYSVQSVGFDWVDPLDRFETVEIIPSELTPPDNVPVFGNPITLSGNELLYKFLISGILIRASQPAVEPSR